MKIRKFDEMPSSRPTRYCLSLQEDCVFADFNIDDDGLVFLIRISFDGFGSCETSSQIRKMTVKSSKDFLSLIEALETDMTTLSALLSNYFRENSDVIWKDALEFHNLI